MIKGAALYKPQNIPGEREKKKKKFRVAPSLAVCFNKPSGSANNRGKTKGTCLRYWVDISNTPALVSLF